MMKPLLLGLFFVCFFILFTLAMAQESIPVVPQSTPVEYTLPYPGILPDHPLFFLKSWRDKILCTLISNPTRRVEYHQLLADKYLNMGIFLVEKQNKNLAVDTIETVIEHDQDIKKHLDKLPSANEDQNRNIKSRFEKSLSKQEEVVLKLLGQFEGEEKKRLSAVITQIQTMR